MISKLTLPTLYSNFTFDFLEGTSPETYKLPANNLLCSREANVHLRITKKADFIGFTAQT